MPKRQVTCPHCDKFYGIPSGVKTGQNLRCSRCQEKFTISEDLIVEKSGYDPEESTVQAKDDKVLIGQIIGGVKIESIIGKGGMGTVYRGIHQNLELPVAVKVLAPAFAKKNSAAVDGFIQEARATAKLQHHNIVSVSNVGQEGEHFYITMQYIDGPNLKEKVKKDGPLPEAQVIAIARQMCDALAFAHSKHIVHRDIKPDNILLESNGSIKLADLGLAVQLDPDTAEDGAMTVMGTPAYMPPEQAKKNMAVDHRADIYALGCTLFQMLCGKAPYRGKTVKDTLALHDTAPIPDVRERNPDVSEGLSRLIQSMMGKHPDDRPRAISDVGDELQRIQEAAMGDNAPTLTKPRKPRVSTTRTQRTANTVSQRLSRTKRKIGFLLCVVCVSAVTIVVFMFLMGGGGPVEPEAVGHTLVDNHVPNHSASTDIDAKIGDSKGNGPAAKPQRKPEPTPAPQPNSVPKPPDYKSGLLLAHYSHNPRSAMGIVGAKAPKVVIADKINFAGVKRKDLSPFARHYSGYFNAAVDGLYRFRIATDDGGLLYVNNYCVVDNDWIHSKILSTGNIYLKQGRYPLDFFYHQNGGGRVMLVEYSTDGKVFRRLSPEDISYDRHSLTMRPFKLRQGLVEYYSGTQVQNCKQVRVQAYSSRQVVSTLAISTRKEDNFSYRWKGVVALPQTGEYVFSLRSNDGSQLFVNNRLIINHDGLHDMKPVKQTKQTYKKGHYPFEVLYFETQGTQGIDLQVSLNGGKPMPIPAKWLYHWEPR